jgi:hypothetical protein
MLRAAAIIAMALPSWILYQAIGFCTLFLPGALFCVPIALIAARKTISPINGSTISSPPAALWVWGNDEDGMSCAWYEASTGWPKWISDYVWTGWRNAYSNLRFVRWLNPPPDPSKMKSLTAGGLSLTWMGWRVGMQYKTSAGTLQVGWQYVPEDLKGLAPTDWRRFGAGQTLSWTAASS